MSRVGLSPIKIPEGVEVKWQMFLTNYYGYLFALMDEIELLKDMTIKFKR